MHDVDAQKHITLIADELKKLGVKQPDWARFVRTGVAKERAPTQDNWWQIRAASILRTIARLGPIGTQKLRVRYGSRLNRGKAPNMFRPASGKIIRSMLQQLETAKLIEQGERGVHKGRIATGAGYKLLNETAKKVA